MNREDLVADQPKEEEKKNGGDLNQPQVEKKGEDVDADQPQMIEKKEVTEVEEKKKVNFQPNVEDKKDDIVIDQPKVENKKDDIVIDQPKVEDKKDDIVIDQPKVEDKKENMVEADEAPPPPYSAEELIDVDSELKEDGDVKLDMSLLPDKDGSDCFRVMLSVLPAESKTRTPCDICVVIDVSDSMGSDATIQNAKGGIESKGFSILDIVKHAARTIINLLDKNDRMSLVVFGSMPKTIFELTSMNAKGKKKAEKALVDLEPQGNTNLWGGLSAGLDTLDKGKDKGNTSHLLLLTDGEPNVIPPRGHLPMVELYKKKHPDLSFTINTFGFGYDLDSKLLKNFGEVSDGMYSFIPDSGFVGTVFVNAICNLLVTVATNATLSFEAKNECQIVENGILGGYSITEKDGVLSVRLGNLQSGQSREVIIRMIIPKGALQPYLRAKLTYQQYGFDTPSFCQVKDATDGDKEIEVATCRLNFIDALGKMMQLMEDDPKEAIVALKKLGQEIQASPAIKDKRVGALLEDVKGQVTLAISKNDHYKKWGIHYLPSLMRAHLLQLCNNFKDPGVQVYGGKVFSEMRDTADDIFLKLPPPTPSNDYLRQFKKKKKNQYRAPINMSPYYNVGGGCVDGKSLVYMADETQKMAKFVRHGDKVLCGSTHATVICVVKHNCSKDSMLVKLESGLRITPWHPIKINGQWKFPHDLSVIGKGTYESADCNAVYNFVLSNGHIMIINGTKCVSLGHGFQDEVVRHPYFGSQQVVNDLMKIPGWTSGLVEIKYNDMKRNLTGLVCEINCEGDSLFAV